MSVASILGLFSYNKLTSSNDEDWVDRLNHVYTVLLLVLFAIFVTGGQYVGNPIECLEPHTLNGEQKYVNSYCWIQNTYYVPKSADSLPTDKKDIENQELTYYQWVPQILIFMAFLFKIPSVLWRMFNGGTGINMDKMVTMTSDTQIGDAKKREETVSVMARYLDRWLEAHRHYTFNALVRFRQKANSLVCFLFSKRDGTYLIGLYFVVKLLYVVNTISQFFILNAFMGNWFNTLGFQVIDGLSNNHNWNSSRLFPKETFCNIYIRQSGVNHNILTTQCLLPINLFNEKIFVFLWYWLVVVSVCTCGNFLFWVWRSLFRRNRVAYVKKYLKMFEEIRKNDDKKLVKEFADQFLRDDGVFVMRIIARNTNDILLSDIVRHLWRIYKGKQLDTNQEDRHDQLMEMKDIPVKGKSRHFKGSTDPILV